MDVFGVSYFVRSEGACRRLKIPFIVVAVGLGSVVVAGSGCSRTVNALSRDSTAGQGGRAGAAGAQGGSGAGGLPGGSGAGGAASNPNTRSCPSLPAGPTGVAPLPTPAQVAYQRTELAAFIHFGLGTFDGTEYGDSSVDAPSLFVPTDFDAAEWVRALKDAGFGQVMLTAKHATGFCLWPSAYTDYSVSGSPWKDGQGDVVKEFTDAMQAADMRVGLYLSPWDEHYPSPNVDSPDDAGYETYFRSQLTELLTRYGPVYEILFDGYNAPRSLDWQGIAELAKGLQPDVLVWMGPEIATTGAELRWIGNQRGEARRSTSSVGDVPGDGPSNVWYPPDAPVSVRAPNWFWHPDDTVMLLESLQTIYFNTVGRNTTLLLNVPPATTGQFDTPDVELLQQFGAWYSSLYTTNLLEGQPATADSSWANTGFEAAKALDGDICTYWAAQNGTTSARLEVTPASPITFQVISIREPIELGERVTGYHVEIQQTGTWNQTPSDASGAQIRGSVIGQRQLWRLDSTTADAIALVIDSARDVPAIAEFGVY
ncbi:MAG: alpha-L-fucosidase [Polyangiaceae bacterium]|nr:alpha-L-fucosidase [Polyangiaceae bacterium]